MKNITINSTKQAINIFSLIKEDGDLSNSHYEINEFCESLLEKGDFELIKFANGQAEKWLGDQIALFPNHSNHYLVYSPELGISKMTIPWTIK